MIVYFEIFTFALGILTVFFIKKTTRDIHVEQLYEDLMFSLGERESISNRDFSLSNPAPLFDWKTLAENFQIYKKRFLRFSKEKILYVQSVDTERELCSLINEIVPQSCFSIDFNIGNLENIVQSRSQRLVFFVHGKNCQELLVFLREYPGVRDVTKCVFLVQPLLDQQWLAENFDHQTMDAESNHPIYYVTFASKNVLHTPPIPKSGWKSIETAFIEHTKRKLTISQQRAILLILDNLVFQQ